MDRTTTVAQLKFLVEKFVTERHWQRFHTPKNLAMGMAVEAAELMDLFKWQAGPETVALVRRPAIRTALREELADVVIYCLALANHAGIDVVQAVRAKLAKNRRKYPARKFRGRF